MSRFNKTQENQEKKIPPFVPHDMWLVEKLKLRKLSDYNSIAVLIFLLLSAILSQGVYYFSAFLQNDPVKYGKIAEIWNSSVVQSGFSIVYSILIVGVPFYIIAAVLKKKNGLTIPIEKPANSKGIVLLIIGGLGICLFANLLTGLLDTFIFNVSGVDVTAQLPDEAVPLDAASIVMTIFASAIVPAFIEEMSLRGILMQPLRKYGDMFAIIVTSLTFALMHRTVAQIPFAFLAGIVLGYAAIATGSIWTSIVIHILNNLIAVVGQILMPQLESNETYLLVFNVVYYAILVIGIACFVYYVYAYSKNYGLRRYPYLNVGKRFYTPVQPYSAEISTGTLVKTYMSSVPFIITLIILILETIRGLIVS